MDLVVRLCCLSLLTPREQEKHRHTHTLSWWQNINSHIPTDREMLMGRDNLPQAPINQCVLILSDSLHVGPAWCLIACEVQFYDWWFCVCLWVRALCGNCFDPTVANQREQDKRRTRAEHGMGFLPASRSLTFELHDTAGRRVLLTSESCAEKIMCATRP